MTEHNKGSVVTLPMPTDLAPSKERAALRERIEIVMAESPIDWKARAEKAEARVAELVAAADRYLRATGEEPAHVGIPARLARSVLWGLVEDARTGPSVGDTKEKK